MCAAALMHGICRRLPPLLQTENANEPKAVSLALTTRHGRRHSATIAPIDAYTEMFFAVTIHETRITTYVHVQVYTNMLMHIHIHMYAHMHMHMHMHVHTHTHCHAHAQART